MGEPPKVLGPRKQAYAEPLQSHSRLSTKQAPLSQLRGESTALLGGQTWLSEVLATARLVQARDFSCLVLPSWEGCFKPQFPPVENEEQQSEVHSFLGLSEE